MAPTFADFPKDVYEACWNKAHAYMAEPGIDALWITETAADLLSDPIADMHIRSSC